MTETAASRIFRNLRDNRDTVVEYRGHGYSGPELLGRIKARARVLAETGVGPGDTIIIIASENLTAFEILLAAWTHGASGFFVDFRTPAARVNEWATRLSARAIVGTRALAGVEMRVQPMHPVPEPGPVPCDPDPMHNAVWFSTSGTTGLPKIAPRTQVRLHEIIEAMEEKYNIPAGRAVLSPTSVGYSASGFMWLRFLAMGRKIIALDIVHRLDELDAALKRPEVAECSLPPSTIRRLAALPGPTPRYPELERLGAVGGPALAEDKVAAVRRLTMNYRMVYSAAGLGTISMITGPEILERPESCGKPEEGVQVTIRDNGREVGPGEIGEICVTLPEREEAPTGDVGYLAPDGYLYIVGRVQGFLTRNGVNFAAQRVSDAALRLPEVEEAAVVAVPGQDAGDEVHLFVQARGLERDALLRHLRTALPAAEQPDHVHLRPALPCNVSGKVDLGALLAELTEPEKEVARA
ncbi:AMP-binding protein [Maritimibacter sp. DP07]|uniref:Long-chain-fatty-acid--CoA ligase n=1 Tax=Maritimibacter harenae TaxID=2606218 RepID=A0A845M8X0_9RHOB|nr:fatty acid--CoA ligase family protein [Maritimibacter harenae]MZR12791.1 AMP-binding protein [Maritimibacter harenae]